MVDDLYLRSMGFEIYDYVERKVKFKTGELPESLKEFEDLIEDLENVTILIPRVRTKDGRILRLLPSFLVPYKQHSVIDIEDALREKDEIQTTASESSIYKWNLWWKDFKKNLRIFLRTQKKKLVLADKLSTNVKGWLRSLILQIGSFNFRWTKKTIFHRL